MGWTLLDLVNYLKKRFDKVDDELQNIKEELEKIKNKI